MKAQVLVSYYRGEREYAIHRVYLEPHFEQAEVDSKMIQEDYSSSKDWRLLETDGYVQLGVK